MLSLSFKQLAAVTLLPSMVLWACANAYADTTQIGRYMTTENKPHADQLNLLSQVVQVRFPQEVQTIGEALNYLLKFSGYSLIPEDKQSAALKTTLGKPLPAIDRNFGPMSLKDGLTVLAGPAFYLVQDPLNRMINFELVPFYAKLYKAQNDKTPQKGLTSHNSQESKQDKK